MDMDVITNISCRVLKKHSFCKYLLFLDVVLCSPFTGTNANATLPTIFATLAVKCPEGKSHDDPDNTLIPIIVGDVITILTGVLEQPVAAQQGSVRLSILLAPCEITMKEAWNITLHGIFAFNKNVLLQGDFNSNRPIAFTPPRLALQVTMQALERVLTVLSLPFLKVYVTMPMIRESSTHFAKNSDRLLLIFDAPPDVPTGPPGSPLSQASQASAACPTAALASTSMTEQPTVYPSTSAIISSLIQCEVTGPAVMRIYAGNTPEALYFTTHPSLFTVLQSFQDAFAALAEQVESMRLHVFPKNMTQPILDALSSQQALSCRWQPRNATHILNIFLSDGMWLLSLVAVSDGFVGDLRDSSKMTANSEICRANAKIREIFYRNAFFGHARTTERRFGLAVDVGASPGGWTAYLAKISDHVIAVDRGMLTQQTENVSHWCVLGQHAISLMIALRECETAASESETAATAAATATALLPPGHTLTSLQHLTKPIDVYTCDANISPVISVSLFIQALQAGLLAKRCLFIITLKNIFGKKGFAVAVEECMALLSGKGFEDVKLEHLLANTPNETTVSGFYSS